MNHSLSAMIFAIALLATPGLGQFGRMPGGRSGGRQTMPTGGTLPNDMPAASFQGTVRAISSAKLMIELEDSNMMEFHTSKKTKFYDGADRIKSSALATGSRVFVEARRAPDNSLDAVAVRLEQAETRGSGNAELPKP